MDNGQKLAEILARYGMLHTARASNSPTSPPAAMPQQSVSVPATPPALPQFNLYNDQLPPMNDYMERQPNLPAGGSPPAPGGAPAAGPMPAQAPMLAPDMPAMPPPQQVGPQGPTPEALALAQALQQRKLLPEQWAGAFSNQYGEPG